MRQTLLRIRLDSLFSLEPVDGIAAIGVGFLLIPWLLVGAWWLYANFRSKNDLGENLGGIAFWLMFGLAILLAPAVVPQFAKTQVPTTYESDNPNDMGTQNGADNRVVPQVPWIPVYGYGFMLFCGFVGAGLTASRRARLSGIPPELVWDLAIWILLAGVIGARLFYVTQYSAHVFANCEHLRDYIKALLNFPDGGLVLYGGVILGSVAYITFCARHKVHPLELGDVVVPSVFVGLAFGRFGCFLNGCCFGDPTSLPWGIEFPAGSVPFAQLVNRGFVAREALATYPLHPTQIYSSLNALILAFMTSTYFYYRTRRGDVIALALITYPVSRIALEALRGDEPAQLGTGLTMSQLISLGVVFSGLALAALLRRHGRGPENQFSGEIEKTQPLAQ